MYKIFLTFLFISVLTVISYASPMAEFREISYDFGKVGQDDRVEHFFSIRNSGDQPLLIERLAAS